MKTENPINDLPPLDAVCYACNGSGKTPPQPDTRSWDCDVCQGTGYQPTQAGIDLLNFLKRQRKRLENEARS